MKLSIFLTSILFLGCGGSNTTSKSEFKITYPPNILVVEDMKKDIALISNRENVTYEIINQNEIPNVEWGNKLIGILVVRADASSNQTKYIKIEALNPSSNERIKLEIPYSIVSSDIQISKKVLKTGADDNLQGAERSFSINDERDVVDPTGKIWAVESDKNLLDEKSYLNAYNKCLILKAINSNSNWRVPTKNELLNLIDYSKPANESMIDSIFVDDSMIYSWTMPENDTNMIVSQTTALVIPIDQYNFQKYPVRCINAPLDSTRHIISTDRRTTGYTHDFSTGLVWSPISRDQKKIIDDVNESASSYCENKGLGWRLPNINELRSVAEDGGSLSTFIRGINTQLVSSTPYNDSNTSDTKRHYSLFIQDNIATFGFSDANQAYNITCVKNR